MGMIKISGLKKYFGTKRGLVGVDLEIDKGKITVIIGRSGEGKSVLIKHIIGLLRPDDGQILLDGQEISSMNERDWGEVRKRFGMLFQGGALVALVTSGEKR